MTSCEGRDKSRVLRSVGVDPTNDAIVYAGVEGYGVYKSTNSGTSWTKITNGILGTTLASGSTCYNEFRDLSISPQNTQKICLTQSGGPMVPTEPNFGIHMGPYCSSDGGTTWTRSVTGLVNVGGYSIKVDPNNSNTVYYGVGDAPTGTGSTTGVIFKSTNFGSTWTELNTGYSAGQSANRIEVHPTDATKVYAARAVLVPQGSGVGGGRYGSSQSGMWISTDSGATFANASSGMASVSPLQKAVTDIALSFGNPTYLFALTADDSNTVRNYYSHDSGATFTGSAYSQVDYADFDPNDATGNTLLGLGYQKVIRSTDGGATWNLYGTTPTITTGNHFTVFRWSRQSSSIVYLGADEGKVYRSADAGSSWTEILSLTTLPN